MQILSPAIDSHLVSASWIRRMFEAGIELKRIHGADKVYDFSLGNPDLPPPRGVREALRAIADSLTEPMALGYMPNAGYPEVRSLLAASLAREQQAEVRAEHVVMTCGAAGAINALFRAILSPGDEVVCPAPYFVEYGFYAGNFGGTLRPVPSQPLTFEPDLTALGAALNERTRAVIINSPNNPAGVVYGAPVLRELARLLDAHVRRCGKPVYLVSDEPYRFLTYDGATVPPILPLYPFSVVVGSFSKSLSLAGERIGYLAANPAMAGVDRLIAGVIMTNRILGFVNAPALGQRLLAAALGDGVDVSIYRERRDAMARVLDAAGIQYTLPKGAFYFFPKVPHGMDDKAFVDLLLKHRVLGVPGAGFGYPGFFRLTFCVDRGVIERSTEGFCKAVAEAEARA
jgi:aspartate aminotransferase